MNEVLLKIILLVISILGTVVTGLLVPYLKNKIDMTKIQLGDEQWKTVLMWVDIFVYAAEQVFNEKAQGREKKAYVIDELQKMFPNLRDEQAGQLIEAAVKSLNLEMKK